MKKIFVGLSMILCVATVSAQTAVATPAPAQSTSKAAITFAADVHDFGTIPQGTPVTYVFNFKNTGKDPLVLSAVNPSCGCTTPEWPKEPIAPGAAATIKATYNAANPGTFTKTITVVSNAATPQTILTIKGEVKPAATPAATPSAAAAAPKAVAAPKKN